VRSVGVVFIHGIFSSPRVWSEFDRLIAGDCDLAQLEALHFSYDSPIVRFNTLRRIPDLDDVADSLDIFLKVEAKHLSTLALVTHSQGGLVAQRYLARTLQRGHGQDLARIMQVVMFACPHSGSEVVLSLRRIAGRWWKHPQESEIRPISAAVAEAHEVVQNRIVHAKSSSAHEYPIAIHVYAGEADNVVKRTSARSVFPNAGVLPGDHFSIVRPDGPAHRSYTTLKRHLLDILGVTEVGSPRPRSSNMRSVLCAPAAGWQRKSVVDTIRQALTAGHRLVVVYGLPRSGKTTAVCDAVDDMADVLVLETSQLTEGDAGRVTQQARDLTGTRVVVLDDILPGSIGAELARSLVSSPDMIVLVTSRTRLDDDLAARLVAVPPLTCTESFSLAEHEIARHGLCVDVEQVVRLLPVGALSLPGALRAFVAETRRTPLELLARQPAPATVVQETRPVADLVAGLAASDRAALAYLVMVAGVTFSDLLAAGLIDQDTMTLVIGRLSGLCLLSQHATVVEVPAVVVDALETVEPAALPAAATAVAAAIRSAAGESGAPVEAALARALPTLARTWLKIGEFTRLGGQLRNDLVDRLNQQGYWTEYVALTKVLIDALDQQGDLVSTVAARGRLARKVAQQGDLDLGWSLLREVGELLGDHGPAAARADLHSNRAFLAHLQGDSKFALQELHRGIALRSATNDPMDLLLAHRLEGNIRLRRGEHRAAAKCYATALACDVPAEAPERLEAETSLAHCELQLDQLDTASNRLARVIRQMRRSPVQTELARALHVSALLAEHRGLPAQALDLARQAADSETRDPAVRTAVERTVWRLERFGAVAAESRTERRAPNDR
jgi:pimeloyl-ACP methyl ester carboxylesterase/tetratricopeptide (TPR) repeat protein